MIVESKWLKSKPKENVTLSALRAKLIESTDSKERHNIDSLIKEWRLDSISLRGVQYFGKEWRKKDSDNFIKEIEGILKKSDWYKHESNKSSELKTLGSDSVEVNENCWHEKTR